MSRKKRSALKEIVLSSLIGLAMGLWIAAMFIFDETAIVFASKPEESQPLVEKVELTWLQDEENITDDTLDEDTELKTTDTETKPEEESADKSTPTLKFTDSERYMLAKIAMAEAEGEDTEGKALVICVVLNRVKNDGFADTIWDVISESGQFEGYSGGRYDSLEPSEDCWIALEMVEAGWDESQGALYFETSGNYGSWQSSNLSKLFTHGDHDFFTEA